MDTPFRPTIRTQAELEHVWRELMGALGFSRRSIWMLVIEDQHPLPQITEITDVPSTPDDEMLDNLAELLEHLAEPGQRFAFLFSRPGHAGLTAGDVAWARGFHEAGRRAGVACEVAHRACDQDLVAIPADALIAGDAA